MLIDRKLDTPHAVEVLTFKVSPEDVEKFLDADHKVWTIGLAACEGFISKDSWVSTRKPGVVMTIIYWESYELWQAIDAEYLKELDIQFDKELAGISFSCDFDIDERLPECIRHVALA